MGKLAQSNDPAPDSCAGSGFVATGRVSHACEVKDDDPDKKEYPCPPGWGLQCEANNLTSIKISLFRTLVMDAGWILRRMTICN